MSGGIRRALSSGFRRSHSESGRLPPLRVCLLAPDHPSQEVNGPNREAVQTALALAAAGHDVHIISRSEAAPRTERIDGVWRHRVQATDRQLPGLAGVPVAMELYAAVAKYHEVVRLHLAAPVDLVAATLWPGEALVCLLDERLTTVTRLVTSIKFMVDTGMLPREPYVSLCRLERAVLERSRHINASTLAVVANTEATFGLSLPPCTALALGTEDRTQSAIRAERHASSEEVEVLSVGRFEPRKGIDVLLAAARRLVDEFPQAKYVFVGHGNWDELRIEVERDATVGDRVRFLGEVTEERLWRLYAGADIVCVPSRYESFGQVAMEAMMFGKPIAASAVGGIPEVVEEGGNALLCPPGDPESLAQCLGQLIASAKMRSVFGRRSRELYDERYTPARRAERVAKYYRGLIDGDRPGAGQTVPGSGPRPPQAPLAVALAAAVEEITGTTAAVAERVAVELLDGTTYADTSATS